MRNTNMMRILALAGTVLISTWAGAQEVVGGIAPDKDLTERVQALMDNSTDLDGASIEVAVSAGRATLSGTVVTLEQARTARRLAAETRGIVGVDNRLSVESSDRSDPEIESEIHNRIENTPELEDADLRVQVDNGTVVLSGKVTDGRLRIVARRLVAGLPGVVKVVDHIETPAASDDEILDQVKRELSRDSLVAPLADIIVLKVQDGIVTLGGTVPSVATSDQAEELALGINGVRSVVNDLVVVPKP
jgi:hyperosmotically inducible protein